MYRINKLIGLDQQLLRTNDLAVLWGMKNRNHLYTTISRYLNRQILFPVFKGLYSTVPIHELNPLDLGKAIIHRYTYLSTESVLAQAGVISQATYAYTFISSLSKQVSVGEWTFRYRQMKYEYLYNPVGIQTKYGHKIATIERAVADLLYYNPNYYFDIPDLINFDRVQEIQNEVGYGGL